MHHAALLGEAIQDSQFYGWNVKDVDKLEIDWEALRNAVQDHVKSVNWVTRVMLRDSKIEYINGLAKFVNPNTISVDVKGKTREIKGDNIVIAVGGRPRYPDIPGAVEYCITSDDIFSLTSPPGKTLIIGAGYIGLECAGFLNGFKFPVSVMVRSVVLRGFDRQMANMITDNMSEKGVNFISRSIPLKVECKDKKLVVTYKNVDTNEISSDTFDTVLFAVGRQALTKEINIKEAGVTINPETKKIVTENERSNVPHIYAVGDVVHGKPELTPVAIDAGKYLARRIMKKSNQLMDYDNVATTVFSPLEYGCVGLSEEKAIVRYGADDLEVKVFHK